ncbi:MAG: hypothetical protein ABEH56_07090 [Salinirussus sp.]
MGVEELPTVEEIHAIHELIKEQWDLDYCGTRAVFPDQTLESILDDVHTLDGEFLPVDVSPDTFSGDRLADTYQQLRRPVSSGGCVTESSR